MQLITSGIPLVDEKWGGVYSGGTYLVIGPRKSGKTSLGLQFSLQAAISSGLCLYFTDMRPKNLIIHAGSMGMDIQPRLKDNSLIIVRAASPRNLPVPEITDENLAEFILDIPRVADKFKPDRIVFDQLAPYLCFDNLDLLAQVVLEATEALEEKNITNLFLLSEPATPYAKAITDLLLQTLNGHILLEVDEDQGDSNQRRHKMTITPNIGHHEGRFSALY